MSKLNKVKFNISKMVDTDHPLLGLLDVGDIDSIETKTLKLKDGAVSFETVSTIIIADHPIHGALRITHDVAGTTLEVEEGWLKEIDGGLLEAYKEVPITVISMKHSVAKRALTILQGRSLSVSGASTCSSCGPNHKLTKYRLSEPLKYMEIIEHLNQ